MNLLHLIRLDLHRSASGSGGEFQLVVSNLGGRPVHVRLDPTTAGGISVDLQQELVVSGGSDQVVAVSVRPVRVRRWGSPREIPFTITATNQDDPAAEPVGASATYLEIPEKRQVYTAVAVFIAAALLTSGAIALLVATGGGKSPSGIANGKPAAADPYTFKAEVKGLENVKNAPAFVCYHLDPENIPYHLRLALVSGTRSDTLTEWDDNGNNGGDCLYIAQAAPAGAGKISLEAWVEGKKVGQVEMGALTP